MRTGSFVFSTVAGSGTVVSVPGVAAFFVAFSGTSTTSIPKSPKRM
jgi:hypothetical protein